MEVIKSEPRIVKSHDVTLDEDYAEWIAEVKHRYRSAQVKAAVKVNAEKLLWNWQMGRDLVQKKAEERWGAGVVEQVSLYFKAGVPWCRWFFCIQFMAYEAVVSFLYRRARKTRTGRSRIARHRKSR